MFWKRKKEEEKVRDITDLRAPRIKIQDKISLKELLKKGGDRYNRILRIIRDDFEEELKNFGFQLPKEITEKEIEDFVNQPNKNKIDRPGFRDNRVELIKRIQIPDRQTYILYKDQKVFIPFDPSTIYQKLPRQRNKVRPIRKELDIWYSSDLISEEKFLEIIDRLARKLEDSLKKEESLPLKVKAFPGFPQEKSLMEIIED